MNYELIQFRFDYVKTITDTLVNCELLMYLFIIHNS